MVSLSDLAGCRVYENVGRLDVLADETSFMQTAECSRQGYSDRRNCPISMVWPIRREPPTRSPSPTTFDISWHKGRAFISEVLRNEEIGFEQMDEDVYRVFFCNIELGEFNSSELRFRPAIRT